MMGYEFLDRGKYGIGEREVEKRVIEKWEGQEEIGDANFLKGIIGVDKKEKATEG